MCAHIIGITKNHNADNLHCNALTYCRQQIKDMNGPTVFFGKSRNKTSFCGTAVVLWAIEGK